VAHQGLDLTFGLGGTSTSHVSGFGGRPLAVVIGTDGRPTLACSAPDQRLADQLIKPGARQRAAPIDAPRVVSFPLDGRPSGLGSGGTASYGPEADDPVLLGRAIAHRDRIAFLGNVLHGGQSTLALQVFDAGQPHSGLSSWTARGRQQLVGITANADRCALGWLKDHPVVVARQQFTGTTLRLLVYVDPGSKAFATLQVPVSRLAMTAGFNVQPWVTSVALDAKGRLLVGITWVGLDPSKPFHPVGAIDEGRASILKLRRRTLAWEPDTTFAQDGLWIAPPKEGEITTADHIAVTEKVVICVGRAAHGGGRSLFAASLDLSNGHARWTAHPAAGVVDAPTSIALDAAGRVLACGSTRPFDVNYARDDPAEAAVVCLTQKGQLDATFGAGGVARFRLNGATYATAVAVTPTGELLVGSIFRWGGQGAGLYHPCVTRLTSAGQVDGAFGFGGVGRHDGLGEAQVATVDNAGRVWSAGVGSAFMGMVPGFRPWSPPVSSWIQYLTVARFADDGGLEHGFGLDGIADHQLLSHDRRLERVSVDSLVPLVSGGAVVGGDFGKLNQDQSTGDLSYETLGTWLARLTANGGLDSSFGSGGVAVYPARWFTLAAELAPAGTAAHGELQGWESFNGGDAPLRLAADGSAAPGFGPSGVKPVSQSPVTLPVDYEADGEWFGPVEDTQSLTGIGLVRCAPDGTIDQTFGAGSPTRQASAYVDVNLIKTQTLPALGVTWERERGRPHRTLKLSDGTYLTLWNATWQENGGFRGNNWTWPETSGLVLIAWTAAGMPRSVPEWANKPVKAIPNPLSRGATFLNWLSWRYRCALLQPDGSIIVGLQGEDKGAIASNVISPPRPSFVRTSSYVARLVPPGFDLDPGFGDGFGGGYLVRRLPGEDYQKPSEHPPVPGNVFEDWQRPSGLGTSAGGAVVAAIKSCTVVSLTTMTSPDLLADGSLGVMRLI
jgi:hypothetical protein